MRRVRAVRYMPERGRSLDTPAAPQTCMARSTTRGVGRRDEDLDGGDFGACLGITLVDLLGGVDGHEAGRLQVHVTVGDEALHELLVLEQPAVDLAREDALDHEVEGPPHLADRVHAVEDPPGTEPVLGGAVPVADLAQHVLRRHPDVVVTDLAVVRGLAAPDPDAPHDGDAGGRRGHDDLHHPARAVLARPARRPGT